MSKPKPADTSKWHSPALEERIARADAATADIKSFNEYVDRHGFRDVVFLDIPGEATERLAWQQLDRDTWGLAFHCDVAEHGGKTRMVAPLIECKMPIRLRMAKLLPRLLIEIGYHVLHQEDVTEEDEDE
jgi:hypothetical protein